MDTCPKCGGELDYEEVDIGVGTLRGNPGCPDCHWTPEENRDEVYERQAARDRLDGFQRTGNRDWT